MEKKESKAQERKEHLAMKIVEKAKGGKKIDIKDYHRVSGGNDLPSFYKKKGK